jgi:N-acetyl-1-D-myo-inositol-2-amino-2-deoxy-alpha-D-glucopyranoside deacetylase
VPRVGDDASLAGKTVLAVFAHPDDESLACGGTLARLADAGVRVVLLCASHGERGAQTGPARDDELGRVRSEELLRAAETLGIAHVLIFSHPDGELRWAEVSLLLAEIAMTVERFSPDAVITFGADGLYWHLDHIGIHERTTAAMRLLGPAAPPLYYVTMPRDAMTSIVAHAAGRGWTPPPKGFWSLAPEAFGLGAGAPTIVVDVADWAERKVTAVRSHQSQTGTGNPFSQLNAEQARRWLGVEHFHRAATDTSMPAFLELLSLVPIPNS